MLSTLWIGLMLGVAAPGPSLSVTSLQTRTMEVEDLAADDSSLWVATRGGLERYELATGRRAALFRTTEGLDDNHVRTVTVADGEVEVRTLHSRCRLGTAGFRCAADPLTPPTSSVAPRFLGQRITASLHVGSRRFVGTATGGVWEDGRDPQRWTPDNQICSNHVMAMADFVDRLWLGSFDEGVCSTADGEHFVAATGDFRMINDMQVIGGALYIAASEGLFRSEDGAAFERIKGVRARGVNGVTFDDDFVYATTPAALWKVPRGRGRVRATRRPGGSRAMQGVERFGDELWIPSEDRGVIRHGSAATRVLDRMVGLPSSWVLDIAHDEDGRLYAGTLRHGLWIVDEDRNHRQVEGIDDWILEVDRMGDSLWVGTQGGAALVEGEHATAVQGLPNPNVHAFAAWRGQVWIATEGGLATLDTP